MASLLSNGKKVRAQSGFTYLGVLIAVAIMSVGLLAVSEVWTTTARRQKLAQLEWVGQQYVQAIGSYYYANTGPVHTYPEKLDDLLQDKRYPFVKRHIRTLYPDPFTGRVSWSIVSSAQGGIQGVAIAITDTQPKIEQKFIFVQAKNFNK